MLDKELLGGLAALIGFSGYVRYVPGIIRGTVRPHVFSWFIWGVLTAIAFVAQYVKGAGAGSWVTGITAMICFLIAGLALKKAGQKNITWGDWITFMAAFAAIPLWYFAKDPLDSTILITLIDALAYYPTYRRGYHFPHAEMAFTYFIGAVKFAIGIVALENYSIVTVLYPAFLVTANGGFVIMVLWRRRVLTASDSRE